MPNEPEVPGETKGGAGGFLSRPAKPKPDEQIAALRKRVAFFKEQARLLLERFERREILQTEARAEAERLGREVREAERQVEQWEALRRRSS
jgi:hypothetical protein